MAVLGLQGVRGGVGTTSVTAALAWSLQVLGESGNDSNLLIVFYVQIMPDDFVMQLHRF